MIASTKAILKNINFQLYPNAAESEPKAPKEVKIMAATKRNNTNSLIQNIKQSVNFIFHLSIFIGVPTVPTEPELSVALK